MGFLDRLREKRERMKEYAEEKRQARIKKYSEKAAEVNNRRLKVESEVKARNEYLKEKEALSKARKERIQQRTEPFRRAVDNLSNIGPSQTSGKAKAVRSRVLSKTKPQGFNDGLFTVRNVFNDEPARRNTFETVGSTRNVWELPKKDRSKKGPFDL